MPNLRLYVAILGFMSVPTGWANSDTSYSQADVEMAILLRDDAMLGTSVWDIVESLTTEIGPRLAGSEAEARARDWAVENLTRYGFENVRVEPFMIDGWRRDGRGRITIPTQAGYHLARQQFGHTRKRCRGRGRSL